MHKKVYKPRLDVEAWQTPIHRCDKACNVVDYSVQDVLREVLGYNHALIDAPVWPLVDETVREELAYDKTISQLRESPPWKYVIRCVEITLSARITQDLEISIADRIDGYDGAWALPYNNIKHRMAAQVREETS